MHVLLTDPFDTLLKVDVILPQPSPFETAMRRLVAAYTLDERYPPVRVASAYEMILFKLQRYQRDERSRSNGMRDDSEWNDVLGMLKVQGPALDLALLERWPTSSMEPKPGRRRSPTQGWPPPERVDLQHVGRLGTWMPA